MKYSPFTYSVLQYVHDPSIGECINIGILLCCADEPYLGAKIETKYEHLSHIFADFNGAHYKNVVTRLTHLIGNVKALFEESHCSSLFSTEELKRSYSSSMHTAEDVAARILPDNGFSFRFTEMHAGITSDPRKELLNLFDLFVASQRAQQRAKVSRSDDEIWAEFSNVLPKGAREVLKPHELITNKIEVKFEHAFKNSNWHVLQPMSMDYSEADYIMMKAAKWVGIGHALEDRQDFGKIYILLGKPQRPNLQKAYIKAKNLLNDIPIDKEFVEESEITSWSNSIVSYMEEHGVVQKVDALNN